MVRVLLALSLLSFLGISAWMFAPDAPPPAPEALASASPAARASAPATPGALATTLLEEMLDVHLRRIRGTDSLAPLAAPEVPRIEAFLASLKLALPPGTLRAGLTSREIALLVVARLSPPELAALPGFLSAMLAMARGPDAALASGDARRSNLRVNGILADPTETMTVAFKAGDRIETSGPIPAALKIGKAWVEIRAASRLTILEKHVLFESGQVLVRVGAESTPEAPAFVMQTPHAWLLDIGTVFLATAGAASSKVEVMAGIVRMRSARTGGWMDIRAGETGWTEDDGEVAKRKGSDPQSGTRRGSRSGGADGSVSTVPSGQLPPPDAARGDGDESGETGADGTASTNGRTSTGSAPPAGQGPLFPVIGGGGGGFFLPGTTNSNGNANSPPLPTPTPPSTDTL